MKVCIIYLFSFLNYIHYLFIYSFICWECVHISWCTDVWCSEHNYCQALLSFHVSPRNQSLSQESSGFVAGNFIWQVIWLPTHLWFLKAMHSKTFHFVIHGMIKCLFGLHINYISNWILKHYTILLKVFNVTWYFVNVHHWLILEPLKLNSS